ncbi:MAG: hypothetical protein KGI28_03085 [Thaumarchaeota archaeon]|nr:hypothetical protein [Nitrososphaerota archaeon]
MTAPPFLFGPGSGELFMFAQVAIITVSLLLMGITISAYSKTRIKRLKYIIAAFALFASHAVINLVDGIFTDIMPDDVRFTAVSLIILSIVILLFIGFVKKDKPEKQKIKIEKTSFDNLEDLK